MLTEEVVIKDSTDADVIAAVKLLHDKGYYVVTHNGNPVEIALIKDVQPVVPAASNLLFFRAPTASTS